MLDYQKPINGYMSKTNLTVDSVVSHIKKYFNVIDVVPIIKYDLRLEELYTLLASLKQDVFQPNDRIIFIFDDTDYYFKNKHGFTLHNIQEILTKLDIPNYFCIILTHQSYLKNETTVLTKELTYDCCDISVFDIWLDIYLDIDNIPAVDFNFDNIKKSFTFLSRVTRKHRVMLFSLLRQKNLLDRGVLSFALGHEAPYQPPTSQTSVTLPTNLNLVSAVPQIRCNENWLISDRQLADIYNNFLNSADKNFTFKNFNEPAIRPDNFTKANNSIVQEGFLYIAAETMFYYPGNYISEKSLKGISAKRPFVILGPPGNLQKLRDYGFKTFDQWWNEDYDLITDPCKRLIAVYDIIQKISGMPINELIALGKEMQEVLQYNYNFLINDFAASQLANLDAQCIENLNRRYVQNKTFNS